MTIFLCGFMGCGKSTVGQKLAKTLNVPFTDMDTYIEEQAGKTIPEIFAEDGEPHFRDLETQAVRDLATPEGVIVLFLDVPFRMCYLRIANTDRPIVKRSTRQELYNLYRKRRGVYRRHSTHRIEAVHSPTQTVQEIIALLEG